MTKKDEVERKEAREWLLNILKPGQEVFTILRSVSKSGMTRHISVVVPMIEEDGRINIRCIDRKVATLLGWRCDGYGEGIKVGGCGMDMGFHLVYQLGFSLWPDGTPEPHGTRNGEPDTWGGYALKQSWL